MSTRADAPHWLHAEPLAALASQADTQLAWPLASWTLLTRLGVPAWSIPPEHGGQGLDRLAQLEGSEQLAAACLTSAFLLSQREAAVRWLLAAPDPLQQRFLPGLAHGDLFVTVGLSQLTTSRQHRPPSLRARKLPSVYQLDGDIPWVSGASRADALVAGAVLDDGRQVLVLLPTTLPGVTVGPLLELAALAGSCTASVHCAGVKVPAELLVAGPGELLVRSGGGLDTSCLALGLARAAVWFLLDEADRRPGVRPAAERLAETLTTCRRRLHALADPAAAAEDILALRIDCTRLVLRATQAALAVAKGAGFLVSHPAQRWVRQAHFFLVWSCPQPVAAALLDDLMAVPV